MKYKFEWNDIRAVVTLINVILVMKYGLTVAWVGIVIAGVGIIKDIAVDKKINGFVMHSANIMLNLFFLVQ